MFLYDCFFVKGNILSVLGIIIKTGLLSFISQLCL